MLRFEVKTLRFFKFSILRFFHGKKGFKKVKIKCNIVFLVELILVGGEPTVVWWN